MTEHEIPTRGHEPTTLSGRTIGGWSLALAGLILVSFLVTWSAWRWMRSQRPVETPLADATDFAGVDVDSPPRTRFTLNPRQQRTRREYDREQRLLLSEFGWVNRERGIARIPIERATEIIVEQSHEKP